MGKNKKLLKEFLAYCQAHPQQRFWQALRNWSRVAYVYAGDNNLDATDYCEGGLVDTFYWEGKNG